MSKMGQAVLEGQEFAQENYNVPRIEFIKMTEKLGPVVKGAAIDEFDIIQGDLQEHFGHPEFG